MDKVETTVAGSWRGLLRRRHAAHLRLKTTIDTAQRFSSALG
ncbi:hypothetical protein [Janibacter sp. Soil728]|nr:hypothetical protein [Janibacter sp. Soil728]